MSYPSPFLSSGRPLAGLTPTRLYAPVLRTVQLKLLLIAKPLRMPRDERTGLCGALTAILPPVALPVWALVATPQAHHACGWCVPRYVLENSASLSDLLLGSQAERIRATDAFVTAAHDFATVVGAHHHQQHMCSDEELHSDDWPAAWFRCMCGVVRPLQILRMIAVVLGLEVLLCILPFALKVGPA
jgi:hypothetical protein